MGQFKNEYENYYEDIKKKYLGESPLVDNSEEEAFQNQEVSRVSTEDIVPKVKRPYSYYARNFAENNGHGTSYSQDYRYDTGYNSRYDNRYNGGYRQPNGRGNNSALKNETFHTIIYEIIGMVILLFIVITMKMSPLPEMKLMYKQCKNVLSMTGTLNIENTAVYKSIEEKFENINNLEGSIGDPTGTKVDSKDTKSTEDSSTKTTDGTKAKDGGDLSNF